ncbi:MAG: DNRLRE domain-containing protein [Clostridiales bacterium]|nr:DNRLRE domain-containing protein [Clostridiales bacterium]
MKSNLWRRAISSLLAFLLVFELVPASAYAAVGNKPEPQEIEAEEYDDDLAYSSNIPQTEDPVEEVSDRRDKFQKEFMLENGMRLATVYPMAVHYDLDGEWEEIDNTLYVKDTGDGEEYHNTQGMWDVSLPAELDDTKDIALEHGGYTLSFSLEGELSDTEEDGLAPINPSEGKIKENCDEIEKPDSMVYDVLSKISSAVEYRDILEDTDLEYELISSRLKETITIKEYREDLTGYQYRIDCEGMTLVKDEDGQILAMPEGSEEPAFYLPAPFIYDSDRRMSRDIGTELKEEEDGYTLTYTLPEDWLSDPERAYPVYLDPVIEPDSNTFTIKDQTVSEHHNLDYLWGCVEVGYFPASGGGGGKERVFMKFLNIPDLSSGDVVVSARITMYKAAGDDPFTVEAHKVNGTWDSTTITWANMPETDSLVEDYVSAEGSNYSYYWDITEIAQDWYRNNSNTGVMFKATEAVETGGALSYNQFYSSDYSPYAAPVVTIAYVNNCGIENTWDYVDTSAGRAGTGYVNTYTGNLVWIHEGLGFQGLRMPVSIEHIYNSNDKTDNRFGLGYGWRTNYNQLVYQWSADSSYYVWEDSDGTRQYFKYKSSGKYENELDSRVILTTTGSGDTKYKITDGKDNKIYFDESGRLTKISNYQSTVSSILVTYSGTTKRITSVTDGAGRAYKFLYLDSALTRIKFVGTGEDQIDYIRYTQTDSELTEIKYSDGKTAEYGYANNHLLNSVTDIDGAHVEYTYNKTALHVPNRITKVQQFGTEDDSAGYIRFTYRKNETTLKDNLSHAEMLQFNNWGSTTCVQNEEGQASASKYKNTSSNEDDSRKTGSQVVLQSKLQNTVTDLTLNGGFEDGDSYWIKGNEPANCTMNAVNTSYLGEKSLRLKQTGSSPSQFFVRNKNTAWYYSEPGEVLTLSAYVKVVSMETGGGGAYISLGPRESNNCLSVSEVLDDTCDWTRIETTLVYPEGISDNRLEVFLHMDSVGEVLFDCVQLERSATASRYNLIDNSDFRFPLSDSSAPTYWEASGSSNTSTDKRVTLPVGEDPAACLDDKVLKIKGEPTLTKTYCQDVSVSGSAGDVYTIAAWAKADSVPIRDGKTFRIKIRFNNTDNTTTDRYIKFNPTVGGEAGWQYQASRALSDKAYSSIRVIIGYTKNCNTACFDGIQMFKEEFGESYTYDSDGNITGVRDLHDETTSYEYTDNDLTRMILPSNAEQTYTYDSHHNVLTATSPMGVLTTFTYDTYGNNTSVKVGSGTKVIETNAAYLSNGNRLASTTNTDREKTHYGYDTETGILNWVKEPGETPSARTNYTYDGMYRLTSASQDTMNASYSYDSSDLLSGVTTPSGTVYGYTYNQYYQPKTITIGGDTILTNYYNTTTHYLTRTAFANGDQTRYSYDSFGRLKTTTFDDDGSVISYDYNTEGYLGLVRYGDRTARYYYDFQGELRGVDNTVGTAKNTVRWKYDTNNNLTKTTEKLPGLLYVTDHEYDIDNRLTKTTQNNVSVEYTYNNFNAISKILSKNGTDTVVKTVIEYKEPNDTTTSYKVSTWKNTVGGVTTNHNYTYDSRGNILSVSRGIRHASYEYNSRDQLIRENDEKSEKTVRYFYDDGGNITKKKIYDYTTGDLGTVLDTINYTYGDTAWPDKLTSYDGVTFSYDAIGNLTGDGEWTYTWEHGSQLAGVSKTGTSISYEYDQDGMRTSKTVNGTTTKYYYAGDQLSVIKRGSNRLHITYDAVGPSIVKYNGTPYFFTRNAQQDIIGIRDASGNIVVSYFYDAWGNPTAFTSASSEYEELGRLNPFRYRGYIYDEETGNYYLNARYYDPEIGRFISADDPEVPTVTPGSTKWDKNIYAYCDNNPVSRRDDGGQCWDIVIGAVVGGIIGGVSTAINDNIAGKGFSWDSVITGAAIGAGNGIICASVTMKGVAALGCLFTTSTLSLAKGSSFGEALLAGGTAALAALVSVPVTNMILPSGSSLADNVANGVVSASSSIIIEGLSTAGQGIIQGLKNTSSPPPRPYAAIKPSYLSTNNNTSGRSYSSKANRRPMLK